MQGLGFMDFWGRGVHSVKWSVHSSTTNHNFWKYIEHFCILGTDIKRAIYTVYLPRPGPDLPTLGLQAI